VNPDIIRAAGAALRLFGDVVRAATPVLAALRQSAEGVVLHHQGFLAGYGLRPRDWRAPDPWHRGYLMGRLARCKERWRGA
jgi:hypothetical protein